MSLARMLRLPEQCVFAKPCRLSHFTVSGVHSRVTGSVFSYGSTCDAMIFSCNNFVSAHHVQQF